MSKESAKITSPVIGTYKGGNLMSYNRKSLGLIISRLRTKKGLSQEKLSALSGISRSHLTLIENGKKTLRLDTFCNIAYALGILPSELLKLQEEEEK